MILLMGQAGPIFAEFNINSDELIATPDLVNLDKLKNILPEPVQDFINDAENIGSSMIKKGSDIISGKTSININPVWWQKVKNEFKNAWEKFNSMVNIKSFLIKSKNVVINLLNTIWNFFRGIFSNRIISQMRA